MQGFILPAITAAEECTSISRLDVNFDKVSGALIVGQGHRVMMRA